VASKKEYATRFSMGLLAALFLITSVGFTILVIWQSREEKQNNIDQAAVQEALDKQKIDTPDTTNPGDNKLQGTQLADFTPTTSVAKLEKIDTLEGTGEEVKVGGSVTAHYTGAVAATGVIFQSSHDTGQPVPFSLSGVIKGWTDGVPGMKVGGKRRLLIPADQAYGANPPQGSGIPVNADLVFDIEIVKVGE